MGYDEKRPLGENETGAAAALPIWMDFMRAAIADPLAKNEIFLPLPEENKKSTVKRAAASPPKHPGDAEAH
jgi:penicillin-binding protein 1A